MTDRFKRALSSVGAPEDLKRKALDAIHARGQKASGHRRYLRAAIASVACAAAILAFTGFRISRIETAYVSLDVNPSISLSINSYGRVIDARAYGTGSEEVLEGAAVKNEPYESAVRNLLDAGTMQPYLDANQDLWIAVQADNPETEAQMESTLETVATQAMHDSHPGVSVNASTVTQELRATSENEGMTATKYIAILELQELDETATMDAYRESSVGEIHAHIDECLERAETGHVWHEQATDDAEATQEDAPTEAPASQIPTEVPATEAGHHGQNHHS